MTDYDLNVRQKRFVMELAKGKSQTQAYIDAGYEPENRHAAGTASWRLLKNVDILNYLNDLISKEEFKTRLVEAKTNHEAAKSLKQLLANVHNRLGEVLSKKGLTEEDRENIDTLLDIIKAIRQSDKTEINIDLQNIMKQAQKVEVSESGYENKAEKIAEILSEQDREDTED